jgi:hypothetical protein
MPFVPLTPDEERKFKPPCQHREHNPPSHMVIRKTMKWQCPGCGQTVIIRPPNVYLAERHLVRPDTTAEFVDRAIKEGSRVWGGANDASYARWHQAKAKCRRVGV